MSFANPLMLLGMLAALIPVLVHLFDRRRARPHAFGAISFVLKSQKRTASRLKLKRILLYTLRTLLFLAIPLALARPEWKKDSSLAQAKAGPAATAILLDTSLSMRWSQDGDTLFDTAQDLAREALSELRVDEPATVILCGTSEAIPPPLSFDRADLRSLIDDAEPSFLAASLNPCLEQAARMLEDSPQSGKRFVLVSDFTQPALNVAQAPPAIKAPDGSMVRPEVVLKDAAASMDELPNRSIVEVKIDPAPQVGTRAFQFTVTVRNEASSPVKNLEVSIRVDNRIVAKGFVDVAARGTSVKSLTHRFEQGGWVQGEIHLSEDGLVEDDRRAFLLTVPKELRALIVNGAPNSVRFRDEAFFVEAALTAPGSPVRAQLRDVEAGFREELSQFDVVLMLNVPTPSVEQAALLEKFVNNGGGLFISMGDNVEPESYNSRLSSLLPRPLRLPKTSAAPDDADVALRAARLAQMQSEHPVFSVFQGAAKEGLLSSRFYRYMLFEADGAQGAPSEVLASLEDGAPAVALRKVGQGRTLMINTSVDRDWSDFAIRTSFLPFIQRCAAFLAGALDEREQSRVTVGQMYTPRSELVSQLLDSDGKRVPKQTSGEGVSSFGPLSAPGVYQALDANEQALPEEAVVAHVDAHESDMTKLKPELLARYFGESSVRTESLASKNREVPIASNLILLAIVAFIAEGLLLRRP